MGRAALDLTGDRFGSVVAIARVGTRIKPKSALWLCRCDCGADVLLGSEELRHQTIGGRRTCPSCTEPRNRTKDPAYACWRAMIRRCEDPGTNGFERYGGRGIRVCQRWRHSFGNFLADMGPRAEGMTIERVDNDGHYEPGNCRWATRKEQAQNRAPKTRKTG